MLAGLHSTHPRPLAFTHAELLDLLNELETVGWQLPTVGHRIIARLQRQMKVRHDARVVRDGIQEFAIDFDGIDR